MMGRLTSQPLEQGPKVGENGRWGCALCRQPVRPQSPAALTGQVPWARHDLSVPFFPHLNIRYADPGKALTRAQRPVRAKKKFIPWCSMGPQTVCLVLDGIPVPRTCLARGGTQCWMSVERATHIQYQVDGVTSDHGVGLWASRHSPAWIWQIKMWPFRGWQKIRPSVSAMSFLFREDTRDTSISISKVKEKSL